MMVITAKSVNYNVYSNCVSCNKTGGSCFVCKNGFYGGVCKRNCSIGYRNTYCSQTNGYCKCKDGYYGNRCDKQCIVNCKSCHKIDGSCLVCKNGYHGDECDKQCSSGCTSICDKSDGVCYSCKDGYYGDYCNQTCHCLSGYCHHVTGSCDTGCAPGWSGDACQEPLPISQFYIYMMLRHALCITSKMKGIMYFISGDGKLGQGNLVAAIAILGCILAISLLTNGVLFFLWARSKGKFC